jgi:hypothetical protein
LRARSVAVGIDAILDQVVLGRRDADNLGKPALQIVRHRHIAVDERREMAAQEVVLGVQSVRIGGVAAMLGVDAHRHAGSGCREAVLHRRQVVGMQDRGPQAPHQFPEVDMHA